MKEELNERLPPVPSKAHRRNLTLLRLQGAEIESPRNRAPLDSPDPTAGTTPTPTFANHPCYAQMTLQHAQEPNRHFAVMNLRPSCLGKYSRLMTHIHA